MNTTMLQQSAVAVTTTIAYTFGQEDARAGQIACPEMWFYRHEDKVAYATGYASVSGPTLTTRHFLSDAEMEAELAEYQDWREDADWHSRGAW